jgi:hypothetical protein
LAENGPGGIRAFGKTSRLLAKPVLISYDGQGLNVREVLTSECSVATITVWQRM